MRRNNKYLLGFAVVVLVPVVLIWVTAWPLLRPWNFPVVTAGEVVQGGQSQALSADSLATLNHWLQANRTGWGVPGETPPDHVVPERLYHMQDASARPLILSIWHFRHGADVAGIQTSEGGSYRMHSFDRGTLHLP